MTQGKLNILPWDFFMPILLLIFAFGLSTVSFIGSGECVAPYPDSKIEIIGIFIAGFIAAVLMILYMHFK